MPENLINDDNEIEFSFFQYYMELTPNNKKILVFIAKTWYGGFQD